MSEDNVVGVIILILITLVAVVWRVCICIERKARYESEFYESEIDE